MNAEDWLDRADALAADATQGSPLDSTGFMSARVADMEIRAGWEVAKVMSAALRAVLDLHRPDPANGTDWCRRCGEAWPCATAQAVSDAVARARATYQASRDSADRIEAES